MENNNKKKKNRKLLYRFRGIIYVITQGVAPKLRTKGGSSMQQELNDISRELHLYYFAYIISCNKRKAEMQKIK